MNDKRNEYNMVYYNQLLRADKKKKRVQKRKKKSFSEQKINIKDYLFVPDGWEGFAYTIYLLFIPYTIGSLFLFFTVAGADFENFRLLEMSAVLIVWAIGYEIVATLMLLGILMMFLKHDD